MNETSLKDVKQALSKVIHPEIKYSLVDLGMIEDVLCEEGKVGLILNLPSLEVPVKGVLVEGIKKALTDLDSSIEVEINIGQMTKQQRENFMKMAKEGWKF